MECAFLRPLCVLDVRGELRDEIQVVELSGGAFVSFLLEGDI
jgi:hypothetical protein